LGGFFYVKNIKDSLILRPALAFLLQIRQEIQQ